MFQVLNFWKIYFCSSSEEIMACPLEKHKKIPLPWEKLTTQQYQFLEYHISEVSHTPFPHYLPSSHNRNYTIQYDISFSCEYYSPSIQSLKGYSFYKTIHFEPYTCLTTSFLILLQSHVAGYQIYSYLTSINSSSYPFVYTINIYTLT